MDIGSIVRRPGLSIEQVESVAGGGKPRLPRVCSPEWDDNQERPLIRH